MLNLLPMKVVAIAAPGTPRGRGVLFGVALAALGGWAMPASAQFSAQPVIMELRTAADPARATFWVRNESQEALQLQVYVGDYEQTETGEQRFMEAGTHPSSCAGRVRFQPENLALAAGGVGEVQVLMQPGAETCWSLIFVQSVSRASSGIQITQRIGIRIYGVNTRARLDGEVRAVEATELATGERVARVTFMNTGEAPVRPEGEIEVRSEAGALMGAVPVPPFTVLPGATATTTVSIPLALEAGTYLLIPILDFGGAYLAGGQGVLEIGRR